jgi:nucleotide-binding universal stress UspA family protein
MFSHLLLATDGSELSNVGVTKGIELANSLSARVTVVTVTEPLPIIGSFETTMSFPEEDYEKGAAELAAKLLSNVAQRAAAADVSCDTVHVKQSSPAEGILETAKARGCDLIVMSTHSRKGLSQMLLGSEANKVATRSPIPVLVIPPAGR